MADDVDTTNVGVDVMRWIDIDDLLAKMLALIDQLAGDDPVLQNALRVVDIFEEQIQRPHPLLNPASRMAHSAAGMMRGMRSKGQTRSIPCSVSL